MIVLRERREGQVERFEYALKDAKDECACLGDFGDDAYDDHSPSHTVKILFVFHLFCHIPQ